MINFLFSLIIYKGKRKYSLNITQTKFTGDHVLHLQMVENIPPGSILFPLMLTSIMILPLNHSEASYRPASILALP